MNKDYQQQLLNAVFLRVCEHLVARDCTSSFIWMWIDVPMTTNIIQRFLLQCNILY